MEIYVIIFRVEQITFLLGFFHLSRKNFSAMADYYKILKVSDKATSAEIKSAYRRLARKHHPDVNSGAESSSREFSRLAKAYEILGNPKRRADYDRRRLRAKYKKGVGDSVFSSDNEHAKRWRQMAYERHYNEIIDRMIADERRESMALQKIIFPLVALFLSTGFVAIVRPTVWTNSQIIGKIVLLTLFITGTIHLFDRLKKGFERYTYSDAKFHDSILEESETAVKPYSRRAAISFIVVGLGVSLGIGFLIGNYLELFVAASIPSYFSPTLKPELVFYPPIIVLLVDLMHSFASSLDY